MPRTWPADAIATLILDGFDDYREHFRQITDGARARFEGALWQDAQEASAARINLYEQKVSQVRSGCNRRSLNRVCWMPASGPWSSTRTSA